MKDYMLQEKMPDYAISRQEVLELVRENDPSFRKSQMKRLLAYMIATSKIEHVGRNKYRRSIGIVNMTQYENRYSEMALHIISIMKENFPMVEYRIWELSWLNEFINHQIGCNYIFLEVEKEGCEFVFEKIRNEFEGKVLLKPDQNQILRYGSNDSIIIDRLISESPKGRKEPYNLAIEKLIVDLFANKRLREMISPGDYPAALENIFSLYEVDQVKLFRYARRRNKEIELREYLKTKTQVELKVG
uniref:Uncharacterized protein n=1 Tax=Eubacterium cellulosolvens (strain ATCC 43171 / JCM 9499 / 6) TaxID=633697 RepID=I5ATY2_EUBC6